MVLMKYLAIRFGENLKKARQGKNISQERLSLMAGVDRSYMGRIERGEVNITLEKAYALTNALDCSLSELLPGMVEKQSQHNKREEKNEDDN